MIPYGFTKTLDSVDDTTKRVDLSVQSNLQTVNPFLVTIIRFERKTDPIPLNFCKQPQLLDQYSWRKYCWVWIDFCVPDVLNSEIFESYLYPWPRPITLLRFVNAIDRLWVWVRTSNGWKIRGLSTTALQFFSQFYLYLPCPENTGKIFPRHVTT